MAETERSRKGYENVCLSVCEGSLRVRAADSSYICGTRESIRFVGWLVDTPLCIVYWSTSWCTAQHITAFECSQTAGVVMDNRHELALLLF